MISELRTGVYGHIHFCKCTILWKMFDLLKILRSLSRHSNLRSADMFSHLKQTLRFSWSGCICWNSCTRGSCKVITTEMSTGLKGVCEWGGGPMAAGWYGLHKVMFICVIEKSWFKHRTKDYIMMWWLVWIFHSPGAMCIDGVYTKKACIPTFSCKTSDISRIK